MRYVAAYMLAALGSQGDPTAADVEKILGSVGVEVEADKLKKVISELKGKVLEDLIAAGEQRNWVCPGFLEVTELSHGVSVSPLTWPISLSVVHIMTGSALGWRD